MHACTTQMGTTTCKLVKQLRTIGTFQYINQLIHRKPPNFKKQSRCRAIRSWMGTITCSAIFLQSDICRRLSRALLPCIPHPSLCLDVARLRLACGVASWRTCSGVSATCSTLLQQRTMTRTNLPAAKPYCSEHMMAQVACVVRTVRLPPPF